MPPRKCLPLMVCLILLPTIIESCAQTRELQTTNCTCEEQADYSKITCPLQKEQFYTIIMSKDNKYEIDCQDHKIEDITLIPTLFHTNRTIVYYGYKNCSNDLFQKITDKLFANSKHFKSLEFKNLHQPLTGAIVQGYRVDELSIESNYFQQIRGDLLENIPDVKALKIYDNKQLMEIPGDLFKNVPNIEVINLGSNQLHELPPGIFANLTKLIYVQLFSNQITRIDGGLFENTPNVKAVELMTNQIRELDAGVFDSLIKLEKISLRKNQFRTIPQELFKNNVKLVQVQLTDNPFLTQLPDRLFANLPELTDVYLHYCVLDSVPDYLFENSRKIKTINLSNNRLKRLNKQVFDGLEILETLRLERNHLEYLEDNIFENLDKLKTLDLGFNQLKIQDYTFNGLRNLLNLNLNNNGLGDLTARSLSYFRKMQNLDLSYNNLTLKRSNIPVLTENSILPQLDQLRNLNLMNNSITSIFSDWNLNFLQLENLNLANNKITTIDYNDLQFLQDDPLILNLENNLITTINLASAELLLRQNQLNKSKRHVKLKGNPIHCDCKIYDFIRYLDKTMPQFVYDVLELEISPDMACTSPDKYKNQRLMSINSRFLTCTIHDGPILPKKCSMQHYEYQIYEKRLIVNCSNNGLTRVPKIMFNRTDINFVGQEIKVYLSGNKIREMPGPLMGYENVVELDLSHNFIDEIKWVPPNIQILQLDHNNLTFLTSEELGLINETSIKNMTFHNNPWLCDCELLNFTKYLQENFQKIPRLHNITCANTPRRKELTRLTPEELCPYSTLLIIVICVVLVCVALCTCITIALYYRYRTHIKVWLYAHNLCLYLITEEEVDSDKPYDAFISFSHEDEDFVVNELMPELETGQHPFKLCVHFRDFQAGEFITTNIARSIEASRRTVVVVSKGFLNSEWGKMEFRTAHTEALKEGRARVIMIVYGDLGPIDQLDPELKAYLSTNTYVKWGTPWFWQNLRYALPHSSKYAKLNEIVVKPPKTFDDKSDLIKESTTPPAATTPPADSIHRLNDPLLNPSALNVSLINGNLINTFQEKHNNNIYDIM